MDEDGDGYLDGPGSSTNARPGTDNARGGSGRGTEFFLVLIYIGENYVLLLFTAFTILDSDCHLQLPEATGSETNGASSHVTLPAVLRGEGYLPRMRSFSNHFTSAIVLASTLGKVSRYAFADEPASLPPWDSTSEFASIQSVLFPFASRFKINGSVTDTIQRSLTSDKHIEQKTAGHYILSEVPFHFCSCLLNHPFLLARRLQKHHAYIPITWMDGTRQECFAQCQDLVDFSASVQSMGYPSTSFYCYSMLVAGSTHSLFCLSKDVAVRQSAIIYVEWYCEYLDHIAQRWKNTEFFVCPTDHRL